MGELRRLVNIGKVLEDQLLAVGIYSYDELKQIGSKQAWSRIKTMDPSACYMRLCALEGAIYGVRWHELPEDKKRELKAFYRSFT